MGRTVITYLLIGGGGIALGSVATLCVVGWKVDVAEWKLRTAQGVREQADAMLADAERAAHYIECVETPTGEYQVIREPVLRRVRRAVAERFEPASELPDWDDSLRQLIRDHQTDRSRWPLKRRREIPTPAELAARLAAHPDPTRVFRVKVVR
jgi:hypothetical protein